MKQIQNPRSTFPFVFETLRIMKMLEEADQPINEGFGWERIEEDERGWEAMIDI